jgi:hypothetical protein
MTGRAHPGSKKQNTSAAFIELMTRPQWVAWRMESRGGRPAKVPHNPMSRGGPMSRRDPSLRSRRWTAWAMSSAQKTLTLG